jgi:serine/threonine-protein kinase RsbW
MPGEAGARRATHAASGPETAVIAGNADGVREGLLELFSRPLLRQLTEESRGSVEIVLAEVLNNISEHAYAKYPGKVDLWLTPKDGFLFVRFEDSGLPMPGGILPGGSLESADEGLDLPEGGFGWFLIRSLAQELTYLRENDRNLLTFCLDVEYLA